MGDHIYEINSDKCTECVGHYETPTCQKVCPIPNTIEQGFGALAHFNLFVARIATASFMAYALGQILDVHVFNRLRQSRRWWLAPTASTLFGNVSDTLAFFFIAFWRSPDAFMAEHWMEIALVDYCFKVLISIVFFLPMYGVLLNMLLKRLADKSEINALQAS